MSSKPIEVNGDSGMDARSQEHRSRRLIEAVDRASQRVAEWPDWKRSAVCYRVAAGTATPPKNGTQSVKKDSSGGSE
jgi:hypothetical protein